jgi:hypothetical protein
MEREPNLFALPLGNGGMVVQKHRRCENCSAIQPKPTGHHQQLTEDRSRGIRWYFEKELRPVFLKYYLQ